MWDKRIHNSMYVVIGVARCDSHEHFFNALKSVHSVVNALKLSIKASVLITGHESDFMYFSRLWVIVAACCDSYVIDS